MDDLEIYNNQIKIVCAFIYDSKEIINKVTTLKESDSTIMKQRAEKIYKILEQFISRCETIDDLFNTIGEIDEDEKLKLLIDSLKTKINQNQLKEIKESLKILEENFVIDPEFDTDIVEDLLNPIHRSDLVFLSKLSNTNLKSNNKNGFKDEDFGTATVRNKMFELYHQAPYYFEQAFSNASVQAQQYILNIIQEKIDKKNDLMVTEFNNLADLYFLSNIDNLILKVKSANSRYQAFNKIITLFNANDKHKLIKKILKENVILKEIFNMEQGKQNSSFQKLFTAAAYPYNEIIIRKYKILMNKSEEEMAIILTELSKDQYFKEAYQNYLNAANTVKVKDFIDSFFESINDLSLELLKEKVLKIFDILMMQTKFNKDIINNSTCVEYVSDLQQIIIKYNLFKDKKIKNKVDNYFIYKLDLHLNNKKENQKNSTSIHGITPYDIWYDLQVILKENNIENYDKIFLKYTDKYSYEFEKNGILKTSDRELSLSEIRVLPENIGCIVCADADAKQLNLFDIYINRMYQRIFKLALKDKLSVRHVEAKKNIFKSQEEEFGTKEEGDLRKLIHDYAAIKFLVQKDKEFFKSFYIQRVRILLKDILTFSEKYDIDKYANLDFNDDYLNIFRDTKEINDLLKKYNDTSTDINEHIEKFINLTDSSKQRIL